MFRKLQNRLLAQYLILTVVVLSLLGYYLNNTIISSAKVNMEQNMVIQAKLIAESVSRLDGKLSTKNFQSYIQKTATESNARVTLIASSGKVIADSVADERTLDNHRTRPEVKVALEGKVGKSLRYSNTLNKDMFYIAVPVYEGNKVAKIVRVALPLDQINQYVYHLKVIITSAIIVVSIILILFSLPIASYISEPLRNLATFARKVADGEFEEEVPIHTNDEIADLGISFNYMAQKLKDNLEEITNEKNRVKALLSSLDEGVLAVDTKMKVILINPAVEYFFGVKASEAKGKSIIEVIRNYDLESIIHQAKQQETSVTKEIEIISPMPKIFRIRAAPFYSVDFMYMGIVVILRDVTELRKLEQMRTDFVANVSHELRTPLTSIKGFVETLLDGALEEKDTAKRFLRIINDESERLTRLIGDILSLSKIEDNPYGVTRSKLQMEKVINNVVSMLYPQAKNKNIIIISDIAKLPIIVANEDMMGQLLINLIDNAIKYTPLNGKVFVQAQTLKNGIEVKIRDTGIGIPKESLPRLFERFYRVDKARSREMGGTGLGLAIVKHIVEVHNGKVSVQSDMGKGTEFTVFLPINS